VPALEVKGEKKSKSWIRQEEEGKRKAYLYVVVRSSEKVQEKKPTRSFFREKGREGKEKGPFPSGKRRPLLAMMEGGKKKKGKKRGKGV